MARYPGVVFGGDTTFQLSPSPDGISLAGTLTRADMHIWTIEGLQPPRSFWERFFSPLLHEN